MEESGQPRRPGNVPVALAVVAAVAAIWGGVALASGSDSRPSEATPSSVSPSPADYDAGDYGPAGDGYGARFAAEPGSSREDCPCTEKT